MKWYNAIVYATGIMFCVALAFFPKTAPAQEVLTARGIICDTAEQVARVLKADDFQASLNAVNFNKANSCAVLEVAFIIHGEKGETVRIHGDAWQVTQIIVAVPTPPKAGGRLSRWSSGRPSTSMRSVRDHGTMVVFPPNGCAGPQANLGD